MYSPMFNPMKRVFKDPELQNKIEIDGYVVVPFYNESEIAYLNNLFLKLHQEDVNGFFSSTFSLNINYREEANNEIIKVCERPLNQLLQDYRVWCGSFLVKASDENSALSVHQDMTLVDESVFTGFNVWCPLVDLTPENGALMILPGSHRIVPTLRGSTIPGFYENTHEYLLKLMTTLYVKAGTAIIFDPSTIHASPPNRSGKLRVVTNTYFTHKDAKVMTCYHDKELNKIEIFDQEDDFMTNYINFGHDIHSRPSIGISRGFVDYDFPQLTIDQLRNIYGVPNNDVQSERKRNILLEKIFSIFSS